MHGALAADVDHRVVQHGADQEARGAIRLVRLVPQKIVAEREYVERAVEEEQVPREGEAAEQRRLVDGAQPAWHRRGLRGRARSSCAS